VAGRVGRQEAWLPTAVEAVAAAVPAAQGAALAVLVAADRVARAVAAPHAVALRKTAIAGART